MRDAGNYWLRRRFTRRRTLQMGATGIGAGAVMALAGCGDDDDEGNGGLDFLNSPTPTGAASATGSASASASATTTATATAQVTKGGTWVSAVQADAVTIDPFRNQSSQTKSTALHSYSRLFMFDSGPGVTPGPDVITGDLAEDFEQPDDLTYTIKLRPNAKFHAPLSRAVTAEDVVYSYRRFKGEIPGVPASVGNRLDVVDTIEALDESTVQITLKQPHGPFLNVLADGIYLQVMPQETGEAFDPTLTMVGSGPSIFESFTPGTSIKWVRNPEWHFGPDLPYLDRREIVTIPEYSSRLNQYLSGSLDNFEPTGEDLQRVVEELPDAQWLIRNSPGISAVMFSLQDADAPWTDPRVRQAMSMAVDRQALLDVAYNLDRLADEGFAVERKINNFVPNAWGPNYWLDPEGSEISAASKELFQFDVAKAKELMSAAGYADGFSTKFFTVIRYGPAFDNTTELIIQFWSQLGIQVEVEVQDYASKFITDTYVGNFSGISHAPQGGLPEPADWLMRLFHSQSPFNSSKVNDPELDRRIEAIQSELDEEARQTAIRQMQDELDQTMYYLPMPMFGGPTFRSFGPGRRNALDYWVQAGTGQAAEETAHYWKEA